MRSLLQPMVSGLGELAPVKLTAGQEASLDDTVAQLVEIGYARVEMVERRGEIAVRGGLLDVFPPTEEHPLRVEFWGDEVEEIRYFRAADQRSLATAEDGLWAPPCRELLLTAVGPRPGPAARPEWPGLQDILGKMAEGITVEGMEALAPALTDRMELLLDYLPRRQPGSSPAIPERIRAAGRRPGLDQPGVPGGVLGERGRRRRGADRPRRSGDPADRRGARGRPPASSCPGGPSPRSLADAAQAAGDRRADAGRGGGTGPVPALRRAGARLPGRYEPGARRHPPVAGR